MKIKATGYNRLFKNRMRIIEDDIGKIYIEAYAPIDEKWLVIGELKIDIYGMRTKLLFEYDMVMDDNLIGG
jgi:hypothetical protein